MSGKACDEALDRLFEFIDHELPDDELKRIGRHLKECPPCEAEHRINEKIKSMVSDCPKEAAPDELRKKVLATLVEARNSDD